jgi:ABC transporter DrrB family efflux protein
VSAVAIRESLLLDGRSLRHIPRGPEQLADVTIQPIIFILLFAYVFGSAIVVPGGGNYHAYLVSGMIATSMTAPVIGLAVGVAGDVHSGLIDRLRALPISRFAVIAGRTLAELAQNVLGLGVLMVCGLVVGWRPNGSVGEDLAAVGLLLLWAFAGSWVGMFLGMVVRDAETAQTLGFTCFFPLMFLSAVFVPVGGLPVVLRQIAEYNPISTLATATRQLFHNPQANLPHAWPLEHPVAASFCWIAALIVIFAPLAVRRFGRMQQR